MSKDIQTLDNKIAAALRQGEDRFTLSSAPLDQAKSRLKNTTTVNPSNLNRKERTSTMNLLSKRRLARWPVVAIIIFVLTGCAVAAGAAGIFKADKTDYPFVDDPQVVGRWESVDFVKNIEDFTPGVKSWKEDLYLKELAFIKDGKTLFSTSNGNGKLAPATWSWTKGMLLNSHQKTASKYEIKQINGSTYLFNQWKSGDYTLRGMEPYYYVMKKADSKDYSTYTPERKVDKIDYPFVDDPQILGTWSCVDLVESIGDFDPKAQNWQFGLYFSKATFDKNGKTDFKTSEGGTWGSNSRWTKGLVLDADVQTASKYEIREINGSTYMFYEWKNGDYIYRDIPPHYYVFKKE